MGRDMSEPLLRMRGVSKTFPGVRALSSVDLTVRAGEIHALMGENGAGKSTLVKVLTGVYPKDDGKIHFAGETIAPASPREAESAGISTVYQEINLIPRLSVAENILLGRQPARFGFLNWKAIHRKAERALERIGLRIDVRREAAAYSVAIQQMAAIARALDVEAKLLILDEPTSSLDEREVEDLFDVMRRLRDRGLAILFITHFLDQVYEIASRVTVLRNGERVGECETANLPRLELVAKLLGKDRAKLESGGEPRTAGTKRAAPGVPADSEAAREAFFQVRGLGRRGGVEPFDLDMREGEIVGLAGLLGSGRTEMARLLFGVDAADTGQCLLDGKRFAPSSPRKAIDRGLAFCSEDRKTEGLVPDLSVRENLILALQASRGPLRLLPRKEQMEIAGHYIRALDIRTPSLETPIGNLSGGNQQKALLARWLAIQPRLIILDEPTRGIDVGAKAEIEKLVQSLRERGMSILFISSELEEVVRNCRRIAVLRDRKKIGELTGPDIDERKVMRMIAETDEGRDFRGGVPAVPNDPPREE
jgi:simple sugar transport system ATP-binding protein